jgi:hypothetical protein
VTQTPQEFYRRAVAAADADGRLPVGVMLMPRDHLDLGDHSDGIGALADLGEARG